MCTPVVSTQDAVNAQDLIPLASHDGVDFFPTSELEGTTTLKVLVEYMSRETGAQVSVYLIGNQRLIRRDRYRRILQNGTMTSAEP